MNGKQQTVINVGTGGSGLTALLAVLKVAGAINVSWLWVFAPLWLPAAIGCSVLFMVVGSIAALAAIIWIADNWKR